MMGESGAHTMLFRPPGHAIVRTSPPAATIDNCVGAVASGRHSITSLLRSKQKLPLWVTSICQTLKARGTFTATG